MLTGAFFGIWVADKSGSWVVGLRRRRCSRAAAVALVHAVFSIHLRADQIVTGTAINFLALGITGYLFIDIYGSNGHAGVDRLGARHLAPGHPSRCPASAASSASST